MRMGTIIENTPENKNDNIHEIKENETMKD